jgi:hypothetical protein
VHQLILCFGQDLSFRLAKQCDNRNDEMARAKKPVPQDVFKPEFYRQPALTDNPKYPEPYRKVGGSGFLNQTKPQAAERARSNSVGNPMHPAEDIEGGSGGGARPRGYTLMGIDPGEQINQIMRFAGISSAPGPEERSRQGDQEVSRPRSRSMDINAVPDEVEDNFKELEDYWEQVVRPLAKKTRTYST